MEKPDYITLKWGTLKNCKITSEEGLKLLAEYDRIGSSMSAMMQRDTPAQKEIICKLIDMVPGTTILLDWTGERVSKEEAKEYVMTYGLDTPAE